jgi:SAM-dependent methyltransferase
MLHAKKAKGLPMDERGTFYQKVVRNLIEDKNASILVCGGGTLDKTIFENLGFHHVTISNLDTRMKGNEYAPFEWKYENAEQLSFPDGSFDYVVIHAAIHHASLPHKVLTELYRVARKGILAFESRDSVIIRLLERYGVTQTFEHAAVYYNDCKFGGVNNTEIPNYIYRWTLRRPFNRMPRIVSMNLFFDMAPLSRALLSWKTRDNGRGIC